MKLLFIGSKKADYLQDALFSGLVKELGSNSVHLWPLNLNYVLPFKAYPRNIGYNTQAWKSSTWFTPNWNQYQYVVVGSCKVDVFERYVSIQKKINSTTKLILLDGGDREELGGDLYRLGRGDLWESAVGYRPFDFIFKREYLVDQEYQRNVFPCPFAFNFDLLPNLPESGKYQVSFWAVESYPIRTQALELIENDFDCKANGSVRNQSFSAYNRKGNFYLQELAACDIVLNFRGGGWDTMRYWEIPAVKSLMISQKPGIVIPNNFEHEKQVIFCNDQLDDLLDLCNYYLKNKVKRNQIAEQSYAHAFEFHSDRARAKYLLDTISSPL